MSIQQRKGSQTFNKDILVPALWQAVIKLDPRSMWRNPVMFVVEVGAVLTLILTISPSIFGGAAATSGYNLLVTIILILTVWFATYAEAVAEGRGRAQAATLRPRPWWPPSFARMITCSSWRARSSPATERSSRASPPSTKAQSPVRARPSSARAAATAAR